MVPALGLFALLGLSCATSKAKEPEPVRAPEAPVLQGFTMKADLAVPAARIREIEGKLGGRIAALRNTVYEVSGRTVQLNTIVAADPADAEKLFTALSAVKPAYALVQKGAIVYELVGPDEATEDIRRARAALAP
jgi:hypothetical protein